MTVKPDPFFELGSPASAGTSQDPFDPEALRLTPYFFETAGVKKLLTTVPCRKPHKHDFVRVCAEPEFRDVFGMLQGRLSSACILTKSRASFWCAPARPQPYHEKGIDIFAAAKHVGPVGSFDLKIEPFVEPDCRFVVDIDRQFEPLQVEPVVGRFEERCQHCRADAVPAKIVVDRYADVANMAAPPLVLGDGRNSDEPAAESRDDAGHSAGRRFRHFSPLLLAGEWQPQRAPPHGREIHKRSDLLEITGFAGADRQTRDRRIGIRRPSLGQFCIREGSRHRSSSVEMGGGRQKCRLASR
jgi:hypothetical protein